MAKEKKKLKTFDAYYVPDEEAECITLEAKDLKEATKRAKKLLKTENLLTGMYLDAVIEN